MMRKRVVALHEEPSCNDERRSALQPQPDDNTALAASGRLSGHVIPETAALPR